MANGSDTNVDWTTQAFPRAMGLLSDHWEQISRSKGFLQEGELNGLPEVHIGLLHGEVSELMECLRLPELEMSKKIPEFTAAEEELGDIIIRTFMLAKLLGIDGDRVAKATLAKSEYNESRPMKHGGKRF